MPSNTYILCPGQGAQAVGMGKDLCRRFSAAREVVRKASRIARLRLASICFDGPEERLNQTDISQPAIYRRPASPVSRGARSRRN